MIHHGTKDLLMSTPLLCCLSGKYLTLSIMTAAFTEIQQHTIASQSIEMQTFQHTSGGMHLHLANDDAHRGLWFHFAPRLRMIRDYPIFWSI